MASLGVSTNTQDDGPRNARETRDYDEDDLTGPNFVDHFSLRYPSSTVKFRGARVHVYETAGEQMLLEDRRSSRDCKDNYDADDDDDDNGKSRHRRQHRHTISVKRMPWTSFGLRVLRLAYTLISLLIFGYAFALSFQIILFLFVNLAIDAGLTTGDATGDENGGVSEIAVISTLLSIPIFLFGFSSLMAIATTFVSEACSGGHLIRAVFGGPVVLSELLYFVFFLFIPAIVFISALFAKLENPWEVACYAWLGTVAFAFCCFGLAIVWCEVSACFQLISIHYGDITEDGGDVSSFKKMLLRVQRAILLVQTQKYSGQKNEQYFVTGEDVAPEGGYTFSEKHDPSSVKRSLYTRMTQLSFLRFMYTTIDPPKRTYSIEEVRDVLPFVTTHNWSLETIFCSSNRSQKIISAKGPSALTRDQITSSFVCSILGTVTIILAVISFLVWLSTGTASYIVVGILCVVCCLIPLIRSNNAVVQLYTDINTEDLIEEGDEAMVDEVKFGGDVNTEEDVDVQRASNGEEVTEKTTMFRLWETSRVAEPKVWVCYTGMLLEFLFLFLLPIITLFRTGNNPIGVVFLIISVFSFLRKYFDAAAILCELGSMNNIDIEKEPGQERRAHCFTKELHTLQGENNTLVLKARLADIVGNISRSGSVARWMWFFGTLVFFTYILYDAALASDDGLGERPPIILVDDYSYPTEKSLQYPTCSMSKGFQVPVDGENTDTALGDYAFMSALAYETTNITGYLLPQWFGEGVAVDEDALVAEYRTEAGNTNSPVYFKLFSFPAVPELAVLSIRGSQTSWDWMVNMQLWSASGLAQIVKWGTPYGWIWTPILDDLVWFIGFIQSDSLEKVSYYKVTTAFVNEFKDTYEGMRLTGASLGGGLAIITAAQTGAPAVAISGLGAELSRNTLVPRVTMDDINKYVFNFIPDRDYIARVGGRPRQHQEAECNATTSNLFGCHSMWRSICEINYRCGSNGRPVICRCHFNFDFPEPEPIGTPTRTFKEACYEQEQAFLNGTGSNLTSGWW